MQPRRWIIVSIVTLAFATGAAANDVSNDITGLGGTTFFGALHTDSFDFTDTFTFTVSGQVLASASLITIGFTSAQNIDFVGADLNGFALTLSPTGDVETAITPSELSLSGPLVLTVTGKSGATGGVYASYSGTMNVRLVPEPAALALLLVGGAALGALRRCGYSTTR